MKKWFVCACALVCLLSCEKYNFSEDIDGNGNGEGVKVQRKDVQFVIGGITEEYSTRATIQSVGCTDLWVWEGSTLLKHQTSSDADFGLPTVSLTYGAHDLTFVASKADGQTFSTRWECSKVKDTFGKVMQVTVSGGSSTSRQVQLARRSSQVAFTVQDAIPAGVKTMHMVVGNHLGLDAGLAGVGAQNYEASLDVSSRVGNTGFSPAINVLTASASEEEDVDVMVEFLDADDVVLYHYERTVKVKPNRVTNLKGNYFQGDANQVSVNETWEDEFTVAL